MTLPLRIYGAALRPYSLSAQSVAAMNPPLLEVLYEDNHLLALSKPAGLPTMGTPAGRPTLLSVAKEYVKGRYHKPGNVYLGVVSRQGAQAAHKGQRRPD